MGVTSLPPIWTMSLDILFVFFDGTPYDFYEPEISSETSKHVLSDNQDTWKYSTDLTTLEPTHNRKKICAQLG